MNKEFTQWLIDNADNMKKFLGDAAPSPEFIKEYAKQRSNPPQTQRPPAQQ
jgi:type II restriction/modification system DNA methylase subunit YeeA